MSEKFEVGRFCVTIVKPNCSLTLPHNALSYEEVPLNQIRHACLSLRYPSAWFRLIAFRPAGMACVWITHVRRAAGLVLVWNWSPAILPRLCAGCIFWIWLLTLDHPVHDDCAHVRRAASLQLGPVFAWHRAVPSE